MKALVLTLLFLLMALSEAKIFSRCELASVLKQYGPDSYTGELDFLICLGYYASYYNTQAVSGPDNDGFSYYGIFQFGSNDWCSDNQKGMHNFCRKPCSAFTDDDITDDIACAKRIKTVNYPPIIWWPWLNNCRGPNMSNWSSGCKL
ncbi:lysozyme C, milk isozyme-like [Pituophis catenifer annectens]|uniref:lysozyme C, milk isozyme-like n=1 Tax=Pituophis catenifer annectens TaxID=94852 RepID=UPI003990F2C5